MQLDKYSGRITYREMAYLILEHFTEDQKDCDVTAADPLHDKDIKGGPGCYGAIGLNLVQPTQDELDDLGLDDGHPVFIALEIGE